MVTVTEKRDDKRIIKLQTTVSNQRGEVVVDGNAVIMKLGQLPEGFSRCCPQPGYRSGCDQG